jgi:eukaryotic-like serine/threonine-protein kinase
MNPDVPSRVRELFQAALAHSPNTRDTYLEEACRHDRTLFDQVAQLLRLHESIEATEKQVDDEFIGQRVGAYQILRLIGAGGMGRVYLGRRADGSFARDVAVKVIDPQAESEELVARFEQERRILASFNHPSIAQLLDAGRAESNQLYLMMEYVDGLPITEYCDKHDLSLRARVALFLKVCDAVADAHRNLIVHRDLKPGNILVDSNGVPKLLDFGIAKPITRSGLEASDSTRPERRRATPAYASPEQLQGAAAQTGMDIYALGVILHELITGQCPAASLSEAKTTISIGPVLKPSVGLALRLGGRKGSHVATGRPTIHPFDLEGDLDAIVLKALEADSVRRYGSVESLSKDLRAYLTHRTVSAMPLSVGYRARKLVRRNPALTVVSALAAIALVIAIGSLARLWFVASRDRDLAREQLKEVRSLANSAFELDTTLGDLPGATAPRRQLVQAISTYLSQTRTGGDRTLALETAEGYRRLGDIQGNPNGPNLGESASAITSYEAALALLDSIRQPVSNDVVVALAKTHAALADVLALQRSFESAAAHYASALSFANQVTPRSSEQAAHRALIAGIHRPLGDLKWASGDSAGAKSEFDRALALDTANATQFPGEPEYKRLLALTYFRLAAMGAARGALSDARTNYQNAAAILNELSTQGHDRVGLRREVAFGRVRLGVVLEAEGDTLGRVEIRRALDDLRVLHESDRADARARRDLMAALVQLADTIRADDAPRALAAYREARQLALTLTIGPGDTSAAQQEVTLIDERLADTAAGKPVVDLKLFRLVEGHRVLMQAGDPPPQAQTSIAATATVASGWSQYLLTFGAEGPAELHEDRGLSRSGWTIPVTGPPPAQTVLLVAFPQSLSDAYKQQLIADINAIPGPRVTDSDAQIVWSLRNETVESTTTARGYDTSTWVRSVREQIAKRGAVALAGRTFPVAPAVAR